MAADLNKYENTYDLTAKKWVRDMTDSELQKYGYKEKTPAEPEVKVARSRSKTS